MRIHQTKRGFVIVRGVKHKQFLALFVDGQASWTKLEQAAQVYASRETALNYTQEIANRNRLRRAIWAFEHASGI